MDGGADCFARGATDLNTAEGSGISIFYDQSIYPGNTNPGVPWTFIPSKLFNFKSAPQYSFSTCAQKYEKIINAVIMQDRNRMGSNNDGSVLTYSRLRSILSTTLVPFVGLDTFYFAAKDLGLGKVEGLNSEEFADHLNKICGDFVSGKNLIATGVCPNGTYMYNFLWRTDGLLVNNGKASMVGVIPSKPQPDKKYQSGFNPGLTWARGYLLFKYSNHIDTKAFHTAIFDAGSSGTRLSLFRVIPSLPGKKATIQLIFSESFNDEGINDFLNGNGEIEEASLPGKTLPKGCPSEKGLAGKDVGPCVIQPLLDSLIKKLPKEVSPRDVKIELFATAGMRTEQDINGGKHTSDQIDTFYENYMKQYIKQSQFANDVIFSNLGDFKTINGSREEGLWTWINLNDVYFDAFSNSGQCGASLMGSFEVGGSSLQIAFPTSQPASDKDNIYKVEINGCSMNVFSKTFLGLGGDDTRKLMRAFNF